MAVWVVGIYDDAGRVHFNFGLSKSRADHSLKLGRERFLDVLVARRLIAKLGMALPSPEGYEFLDGRSLSKPSRKAVTVNIV